MELMVMRNFYVALAVDSLKRYEKHGILDDIIEEKKAELPHVAPILTQQLGMNSAEEVFEKMTTIFECANWSVTKTENGIRATATQCQMCNMAKQQNTASPCQIYCLNPLEAMVKSVAPEALFEVVNNLYDDNCCRVEVTLQ